MVAMFGQIMPAPLAMPSTRISLSSTSKVSQASFGKASVVMMARAKSVAAAVPRLLASRGAASAHLSMGIRTPITPVDAGSTSSGATPAASAASSRALRQSALPGWPVQALACPALMTTARVVGFAASRSLATSTGAAGKRLVVNTPAAAASTSLTTMAMSLRPEYLRPASATAKRNPLGVGIMSLSCYDLCCGPPQAAHIAWMTAVVEKPGSSSRLRTRPPRASTMSRPTMRATGQSPPLTSTWGRAARISS